jgi:hypothetical protein
MPGELDSIISSFHFLITIHVINSDTYIKLYLFLEFNNFVKAFILMTFYLKQCVVSVMRRLFSHRSNLI